MIERLLILLSLVVFVLLPVSGQTQEKIVPLFPVGPLAYTVNVVHRGTAAPIPPTQESSTSPNLRKSVSVLRIDKIVRYQITWTNGEKTEVWQDDENHVAVAEVPGSKELNIFPGSSGLPTLLSLQPEALDWIKGNGTVISTGGKKAIYFQRMMTFEGANGPYQEEYQAWIDPETALPITLDDSSDRYEFTFAQVPSPNTKISLPQNVLERIARYKRAREKPRHL